MAETGSKSSFFWSLKPLLFFAKVFVGVPLDFSHFSKTPPKIRQFLFIFGYLILMWNLLINGPRGINIANFAWMDKRKNYRSPFIFFKDNSDALLQFVVDSTTIIFFTTVPLIQFIFLTTITWSRKWADLISTLKVIANEMKLSKSFYRKCRTSSLIALFVLLLVFKTLIHIFELLHSKMGFINHQDFAAWKWKYSHLDSDYVADERWQTTLKIIDWLPKIFRNPLPSTAALWARMAEMCITSLFSALTLIASCLFKELGERADDMNEKYCTDNDGINFSEELEKWHRHYNLICKVVKQINKLFGIILVIQTSLAFASPIFKFNKILLSRGKILRFHLEFAHAILRFPLGIVVPSYLLKKVGAITIKVTNFPYFFHVTIK